VWTITSRSPSTLPVVRQRPRSSSSGTVIAIGSRKTRAARSKGTPCFRRFDLAFRSSQSNVKRKLDPRSLWIRRVRADLGASLRPLRVRQTQTQLQWGRVPLHAVGGLASRTAPRLLLEIGSDSFFLHTNTHKLDTRGFAMLAFRPMKTHGRRVSVRRRTL
jgi:hypothetical protein